MSDDEVQSHLMHHRCPFFLHSFVHTLGPMGSPMTFVIALIIEFESFIKTISHGSILIGISRSEVLVDGCRLDFF